MTERTRADRQINNGAKENEMFRQFTTVTWLSAIIAAFLFSPVAAAADAVAGKKTFRLCAACHTLDAKNRVGPHLADLVGRPVASVEGFKYSKAMVAFAEDGKTWDEEHLTEYLASPRTVVKGTSMAFAGIKKPEDIANLIEFLTDPDAAD